MRNLLLLLISFALIITFGSCKKENSIGPQGPKGETGIQGPKGEDGIGAKSMVFQVRPSEWQSYINDDGGKSYSIGLDILEVNDDIYLNGAVLAYMGYASTDYYEAIPQTFDGVSFGAIHSVGHVLIDYHAIDGTDPGLPVEDVYIKIVVIPATMGMPLNIDFNNYEEVKEYFQIRD